MVSEAVYENCGLMQDFKSIKMLENKFEHFC
jgi:hypothetical protein